jgi:diaminopimelate decarboxylase
VNHFHYRHGQLFCEDVALSAIAAAVGTPVYVYSSATLARHYQVFRDAFAPRSVLVAYAMKANSNLAVVKTLADLGAGADTVSAGEIARALKAGVPASRIVFSGVGKSAEELAFALRTGVHQINLESVAEFDMLAGLCEALKLRASIAIRVNPDVGAGGHDKISTGKLNAKFGVSVADARALHAKAHAHPLIDARGFAVHIGSQIKDLAPLEDAFVVMRALAQDTRRDGLPVERLDLGGGLGVPYFNEQEPPTPAAYAALVQRIFGDDPAALIFEPGRLIAANAGILLSRVIRLQTRPERAIVVLDAAMNDLIRPAMYEAFHDIVPVRESAAPARPVDVVGPICETGDTFARGRPLSPLAAGDLVAFMSAGAYGAVMASAYNSRDMIAEVLVRGDRFDVVRRRWTLEEQIALETIPD